MLLREEFPHRNGHCESNDGDRDSVSDNIGNQLELGHSEWRETEESPHPILILPLLIPSFYPLQNRDTVKSLQIDKVRDCRNDDHLKERSLLGCQK